MLALYAMARPNARSREMGKLPAIHGGAVLASAAGLFLIYGCASPGQPKPPSLRLPQVVQDLSARRVGDTVSLRWTTPSSTTDNLPVPDGLLAVLCRRTSGRSGASGACVQMEKIAVHPGATERAEVLPPELITGSVRSLAYRVEILNNAGRSAGRSDEAFAAAGAAPEAPQHFRATPIRGGVRLEWTPQPGGAAVELDRVNVSPLAVVEGKRSGAAPPGSGKISTENRLSAGPEGGSDVGGVIDRTVVKGTSYRYTAQRVRTVSADGHSLEMRSDLTPAVTLKVLSDFPPQVPIGLVISPGGTATPAIDLSWSPGVEADLAGYNVYRRELGTGESGTDPGSGVWRRLNAATVAVPGYEDTEVRPGVRYLYRVTAIDTDGNESSPGTQVQETPGRR